MNAGLENIADFRWGIERETHRVSPEGTLSAAPHPAALKEPSFTKDFAESQLELVTRPRESIANAIAELRALTDEARDAIGCESLWPFSMPPLVGRDASIPVARMGAGDSARQAERYRAGLSARYGIARQLICGVHVNVSFGEKALAELKARAPLTAEESSGGSERDAYYLRLARNLVEDMPSLAMLFGATPFDANAAVPGASFAYSVRNSPKGYARAEYRPFLELGSIPGHIAGIRRGMETESEAFRKLGLIRDGKTVQLNGRVFQKEKEFYAPVRFKRVPAAGETALAALARRGVEYVELRFFDVDPFSGEGIAEDALRVAHLFVVDALARASVPKANAALRETLRRADEAALSDPFKPESENGFLADLLRRLDSLSTLAKETGTEYERALGAYRERFARPGSSPSATLARQYLESGLAWPQYGMAVARSRETGKGV